MKTLFSFLALVSVLTISYISQAQQSVEMPKGEHAMANDGSVYVIYTEEQNRQLEKMHSDFMSLQFSHRILIEQYWILSDNFCILQTENQKLSYKLSEAKAINNELKLNLDQSKEKKFMRAMGVSLLVGLGMGALGVGIGSAL